jgi:hypothetical protein
LELFLKKELTTREGEPTAPELIRYKVESSALQELFQKKEPTTRDEGPTALELIRYERPDSNALELFLLLTIVIALPSSDNKFQTVVEDSKLIGY